MHVRGFVLQPTARTYGGLLAAMAQAAPSRLPTQSTAGGRSSEVQPGRSGVFFPPAPQIHVPAWVGFGGS